MHDNYYASGEFIHQQNTVVCYVRTVKAGEISPATCLECGGIFIGSLL